MNARFKMAVVAAFLSVQAGARTLYVDSSRPGNNGSGLSWATAMKSIQAALDLSQDGDTVIVAAGTYNEKLEISSSVTLKSASGAQGTTIRGPSGYSVIRILAGARGTVIDGFEITGGTGEPNPSSYGYDYYGGGVRCRADSTIRNCIIHGNGHGTPRTNSGTFGGGVSVCSGKVLVDNCLLYDNFAWACGGAFLVEGSDGSLTVNHCTVTKNESTDFFGYQGGIGLANGATAKVYDSILWGNGGVQIDAFSSPYNANTKVQMSHCCVQGGAVRVHLSALNPGTGNITDDPLFVHDETCGFRLAAGSPCIDAGDNSRTTGTTDLSGNQRIVNGTVDIGCYEYGSSGGRIASKYTIKFKAAGGKLPRGKRMNKQKAAYGKPVKLRKNAFKRKGFVFLGWATRKNGPVKYKDRAIVRNLCTNGGTVTLYAAWARKTYYVVFCANGGTGTMAKQKMSYGKAAKLRANKFTRKGHVFKGWAKSRALAQKGRVAYKNKKKVKNLVTTGRTVKLYAVWKNKSSSGGDARLGKAIGAPQYAWTTSHDPWVVTSEHACEGTTSVQSSGGGGGVVDTWMKTTVSGSAKTMSFQFQKSYYYATFSVQIDGRTVFSDNSCAYPDSLAWSEVFVSIPEGRHEVKFNYHHPGQGWAYRFNGVRIDAVRFQ